MKRILLIIICCSLIGGISPSRGEYVVGTESLDLLENAADTGPDNYALYYYLGKVYLAQGNVDGAIGAWARYLGAGPGDGKADAVREQLTLLKLRQASAYARDVVQKGVLDERIGENTLAVLNFRAPENSTIEKVSKGLTAMIITDLSKVPALKIVEREKMQALLQEIRLGQTGIVDESTAVDSGRLLLARNIVRGEIADLREAAEAEADAEKIRIDAAVTETSHGQDLGKPEAQGPMNQLFDMEKKIVFGVLSSLGMEKEEMDEALRNALEAYHTKDIDALIEYSQGLDLMDQGQFAQAKEAFGAALEIDPAFDLANDAYLSTPTDLSTIEDVEGLEYAGMDGETGDGASGDAGLATAGTMNLDSLEVVDAAQNEISASVSSHELFGEAPAFPSKPSAGQTTGAVRIEW